MTDVDYNLIKENFPEAIVKKDGKEVIDFESLCIALVNEVIDLRERNEEKDYQILHIMNSIDSLEKR